MYRVVVLFFIAVLIGFALLCGDDVVVYKSASTGMCVKVQDENGVRPCRSLGDDAKYSIVWVR